MSCSEASDNDESFQRRRAGHRLVAQYAESIATAPAPQEDLSPLSGGDSFTKAKPTDAKAVDAGAAGPSVLVVDDDDFVRELVVTMLTDQTNASRIELAADGEEGLAMLKGEEPLGIRPLDRPRPPPFALVLMDLQMPHMDGLTCIRAFRAWEATQQNRQRTLTVAVSANGDDAGWRDECLAAGFDDVVEKPLKIKTLKDLLVRAERHTLRGSFQRYIEAV